MQTSTIESGRERSQDAAFVAQLIRLQGQVNQMNRQLDRIEHEMRAAISELGRQRFEEYR